jgi:hypothetical protein
MTNKQIISEIRRGVKAYGLVFNQSKTRLNGSLLWQLKDRATGEIVIKNYRLLTAYSDYLSGYTLTYNPTVGYFEGLRND